jgi:hypothetical protein
MPTVLLTTVFNPDNQQGNASVFMANHQMKAQVRGSPLVPGDNGKSRRSFRPVSNGPVSKAAVGLVSVRRRRPGCDQPRQAEVFNLPQTVAVSYRTRTGIVLAPEVCLRHGSICEPTFGCLDQNKNAFQRKKLFSHEKVGIYNMGRLWVS